MSLNDLAYSLLNKINPMLIDDETVSLRQVKNWIIDTRAVFIKNNLNTGKNIDQSVSQYLNNLKIVFNETTTDGFKLFRTIEILPEVLNTHFGPAIIKIGDNKTIAPYKNLKSSIEENFSGYGRFNQFLKFSFIRNNYMYIKTKDPLYPMESDAMIYVQAIFSDPRELSKYKDSNNKPFYSDKYTSFPMDKDMKKYIETEIIKMDFSVTEQSIPDEIQDARDVQGDKSQKR